MIADHKEDLSILPVHELLASRDESGEYDDRVWREAK